MNGIARPRAVMDVECYVNYFLIKFALVDAPAVTYDFEMFEGHALDVAGVMRMLAAFTLVDFNGNHYDIPMVSAALMGYTGEQLKWLSDTIIQQNMKPWDLERDYNIHTPKYVDHIDLIEVMPGMHGLKMYMGKMHSRKIQDLPIEPSARITPEQRPLLREYCGNDLIGTIDALRTFDKAIRLREQMSSEYGIDLRSKSDAQIAEAVIKHELGFKVNRPEWAVGTWFNYDPPEYIQFQTPMLQQLLTLIRQAKFYIGANGVVMPPELDSAKIIIGSSVYKLGIGGLHSSESGVYHLSDADTELEDIDAESFYPQMIINSGAYPPNMGEAFQHVFRRIVARRLDAKHSGDKATADSLKITINGTFGKTLSKYGLLSAPKLGIQTTVTGQLLLLMLIESFEVCGISVVSANTDGIVVKYARSLKWLRDDIVLNWEKRTGLKTEGTKYAAIFSRDVNCYMAVKAKDRSVKLKGEYAPPIPVGGSWPNPTGEVCVDAMVAYLLNGVPLETTIQACMDVRKFVYIRTVRGGGQFLHAAEIEAATTKSGMRAQLVAAGWIHMGEDTWSYRGLYQAGMKDAHRGAVFTLREEAGVKKEYLGKVVRWYYGAGSTGLITYVSSGNKVAKTEGCRPLMELPDTPPADIDYAWYVREAKSMLTDVGVAVV